MNTQRWPTQKADRQTMTFRQLARNSLQQIGLLEVAERAVYWARRVNPALIRRRRDLLCFYGQFLMQGDLCFDIGANYGGITDIFLQLRARVVSVEPQSTCVRKLQRFYGKRAAIVHKAVSDREGWAELWICDQSAALSTLSGRWRKEGRYAREYSWTTNERVPLTTLDCLISEYGLPKFCKIDVEGFEDRVLLGLSRRIAFLSFEFVRENLDVAERCIEHLTSLAPAKFNCSLYESKRLCSPEWICGARLLEKLRATGEDLLCGEIVVACN